MDEAVGNDRVQVWDSTGAGSGTSKRFELAASDSGQQVVIATAWAGGENVRISLTCSGTNRVMHADGKQGASVTQIFAVDAGFRPWVEAKVEGTGAAFDMVLRVTALSACRRGAGASHLLPIPGCRFPSPRALVTPFAR